MSCRRLAVWFALPCFFGQAAFADAYLPPGDVRLRFDLERLNDAGLINVPLTAWPVSTADIETSIASIEAPAGDATTRAALARVRARLDMSDDVAGLRFFGYAAGAVAPRVVRGFEDTPRAEGETRAGIAWADERLFVNLQATLAANPDDDESVRPDGTYAGVHLGNWTLSAGWQDRWYGPGQDGSLILSTNARPPPGIMLQRRRSTPFETRWLSWIGPWSVTTFMALLPDERVVNDAWQFGLRASFRPVRGLEIGLTRTALWCGDDRPCDLDTFADLVFGNDNRGVNIDPGDEPGDQLGGFDVRWALPGGIPAAVYAQWIGEDGRPGGGLIGSWLRQGGVEAWGELGGVAHRSYFEVADTMCREGGLGFSDAKPDCGYEHGVYRTGYRYENRSMGHAGDSDSLTYSLGSTLVQSGGQTWNVLLRYMEINRVGLDPDARHTLSPSPVDVATLEISHVRDLAFGRLHAGLGYTDVSSDSYFPDDGVSVFLSWSSR